MIDINELPFENLKLASDIEAKGFWEKVHTKADIHCIASKDIDSGEIYLFHDYSEFDNVQVFDKHDGMMYTIPERTGALEDGFRWWEKATLAGSKLIVHNARTYDEPIVHKVDPDTKIPYKAWIDTFNQSKRQWFERPTPRGCKGAHGLEPWGKRLGISKPPVTDWEEMDAYKLHRVIEDIHIQEGTYLKLEKERQALHANFGIDMRSSVMIEDMYATECHNQERNGALVDEEHYEKCVEELDGIIKDLTHEIEPQLPMTVKGASTKASRKEVAEALGFDPARVKDKYYQKKKHGEVVTVVEKPFSKPSVNFYRTVKQKMYSATNIEHGFSGKFKKKALLNAWVKENYPNTKLNKDWEVEVDVEETKYLNKSTCEYFGVEEDATDLICGPHTKVSFEPSRMTQHEKVKGKLIREGWHYAEEWNLATDVYGDYIKVDKDTEVRWPPKAAPEHQIVKLVKEGGLLVSSPKLSEEDYDQLPEGLGRKIANYNTYMHRRRFLSNVNDPENKGLMSFIDERGRIPCGVNNFATRSGRGSQRVWVNAPSESALYGEQIRKGVIAGKGNKIVGVDMKSAQLSIAAYYANNNKYYDAVASGREEDDEGNYLGESAHCFNARAFGLVSHADWAEAKLNQQHDLLKSIGLKRKKSKGGSFSCIFGSGGEKMAVTLGIPKSQGNEKKENFLREIGLDNVNKYLKEVVADEHKYKGGWFLPVAFGYWLWNNSHHKNLNTVVQGFEAVAQKLAVVRAAKELEKAGLSDKAWKVLDVHDEMLYECREEVTDQVGAIVCKSYTWAADQIYKWHVKHPETFSNYGGPKFPIDLDGGFKVGNNYYEVH